MTEARSPRATTLTPGATSLPSVGPYVCAAAGIPQVIRGVAATVRPSASVDLRLMASMASPIAKNMSVRHRPTDYVGRLPPRVNGPAFRFWLVRDQLQGPLLAHKADAAIVLLVGDDAALPDGQDWQGAVVERPGAWRATRCRSGAPDAQVACGEERRDGNGDAGVSVDRGGRVSADRRQRDGGHGRLGAVGPRQGLPEAVRSVGARGAEWRCSAALLLAARRRAWAWNVVTDPLWGKVGLWFWAGLRLRAAIAALGAGALGRGAAQGRRRTPTCRCR